MSRCFVIGALFAVSTAAALGAEERGDVAVRAGTKLLKEGDRLADQGRPTDAVVAYKNAFERLLPGVRKLPFLHAVKRDVTRRVELKAVLLKELEEDMTPEEFRANELALKAFGLVPRDYHLKDALAQLYSEEVAAFYDPRTKTMHLIEEPKRDPAAAKRPSLLERLLGKDDDFDKDENKTVIAHELTHALADQHYDLEALQKLAQKNDDRSLALSALIEGEATLVMMGASQEDWSGEAIVKLPAKTLDWAFGLTAPLMPLLGAGKSMRSAPPIIAESMMFPYLKGLVFCAALTNAGGWKAIDAAYREPPESTEQILHPEKYQEGRRDAPTRIDLGRLDAGKDWKEVGRNVLGELQLQVLLRRHGGNSAAAGWDGDQYAVFEGPEGRLGLVWLTTWDTESDAREFHKSYVRHQIAQRGGAPPSHGTTADTFWREVEGRLTIVQRRGLDVAVVEGLPVAAAPRLLEAACRARKSARNTGHAPLATDHEPPATSH